LCELVKLAAVISDRDREPDLVKGKEVFLASELNEDVCGEIRGNSSWILKINRECHGLVRFGC
jgi:hypothetical protein